MAKVKFNLIFNGNPIRTLEELRENFSVEDALSDYQDGRLERWLEARWFREELAQIQAIQATDRLGILAALVRIFDVKINPDVPEMAELLNYLQEQAWCEEQRRREEQERREREEQERREREEKERREREEQERREREEQTRLKVKNLNSTYSEKSLGSVFTEEQSAAIRAGTFDGMALGDYWTIGGVNWRIAEFDYLIRSEKAKLDPSQHHVMIVPDKFLYTHPMNERSSTEGAYAGSKMRAAGLDKAKDMIKKAFGEEHILMYQGNIENGEPVGVWTECSVELMTREMVFSGEALTLFRVHSDSIKIGEWYWLQDVVSASCFAGVSTHGNPRYTGSASYSGGGVRPAFAIH